MTLSPPRCAVNMEQRLAALRRDQEIDGLRVYLIKYNLFPRNRDPHNSPIRVEELKELVKHWKLHRQRGFWRDHPDKEDLVRALLQHIKSEAANKKRRQDAQDKYRAKSSSAAGVDAAKMRDFANILHNVDSAVAEGGDKEREHAVAAAKRKNFGGGDLFYQRGDYDEGMIYLSRIDKTRFLSEEHDPRADLLTTSASAPTPLDHLMMLGNSTTGSPAKADGKPHPAASTATILHHAIEMAIQPTSASAMLLTRESRLRSVEGFYTISCHRGFEAQLMREGALATISAVIKADDAAIRLFAAATLLNLTIPPPVRGQKQQQQPHESDALLALQANNYQSQHHQHHHSMTHLPLATRELYTKMVDEGAIGVLLELSHTPHATVKAFCARALLRLSLDDAHHFTLVHEGAVAALSQLMAATSGADDGVRETCMLALVNLAAVPRAVTCDAILSALTALVKTGDAQTQRRCAQAMLNLSILPTTRSNLVEDGAVAALALLAATRQVPVLDVVACVLCNLAGVKTNQEQLVKNGALPIVLDVLDAIERAHTQITESSMDEEGEDENEDYKAKAAGTKKSAAEDTDAEDAVRLLLARIRKNCVNVIAYLCCNAKLQARVGGAGAVAKMLRILQAIRVLGRQSAGSAMGAIDSDTEKFIVLSIANLALEDRCRPGIVQDGAVSVLLRILQDGDADDPPPVAPVSTRPSSPAPQQVPQERASVLLKLDCVTALSNLMLHPLNFARLVDEGVVPAFIAQLRSGHSAEIQRACAYALLTLARDPGMKTRLAQVTTPDDADNRGGAIPAMLAFASSHLLDAELCGVCVSFLLHLSTRMENHEALFFEGAPALLMRVLHRRKATTKGSATSEPPRIVIYSLWMDCMATLSNLSRFAPRQVSLLIDGVMEAIQHFLTVSGSAREERVVMGLAVDKKIVKTQLAAANILYELHTHCCQPESDGNNDAFFASLLLLATQSSARNSQLDKKAVLVQQRAAQRCALTIARVALHVPRGLKMLAAHTEIPPALNMVMRTGLHEAQVCAAIALCNLATERGSLPKRVWRDPTTEDFLVIALLRLNRDQTKVVCAKALFNLLSHEDTRAQLVADGALYALLKLAKLESDEIRDLALRAVYNLSLDAKRARQLLDMELVRVLAKMYQAEFARAIKKLVCGILSNLSSGGSAGLSREEADDEASRNALQILHEGALGVLRNLVKVRDPETKVYALNTLYNLSCASDAWEMLVRDEANVLALLVAELKTDGSREGSRYAAMALANLSGSFLAVSQLTDGQASGTNGAASVAVAVAATTTPVAATVSVLNEAMKRSLAGLSADESARVLAVPTLCACVLALRNLFTRAVNRRAFVVSGGVQTLAAMLASEALVEREPSTLQVAADMLCALAKRRDELGGTAEEDAASNQRKQERLVKDGVVRALAAIVRGSVGTGHVSVAQETKTCMDIAASLCSLSTNAACHEGMLRDGALDAVADLCRTNPGDPRAPFKGLVSVRGEEFVALIAVTLRNLSRLDPALVSAAPSDGASNNTADEVKGQRLAAQPATVQVSLALALSTVGDTRMHVAATLFNLSRHRKCRQQMIKNDAARVLLRLGSPAATALKRHLCALTLQKLAKHTAGGEEGQAEVYDDPHVSKVVQEGIVAAIARLAEQHQPEVLAGVGPSITGIVDIPGTKEDGEQLVLVRADSRVMVQKGAMPDWERVFITDLSAWPELSTSADGSADASTGSGNDQQRPTLETDATGDEEAAVVVEEGDSSDDDAEMVISTNTDGKKPGTPAGRTAAKARSPMTKGTLSPVASTKKATAATAPRTCSTDVVLGSVQLLSDDGGDKVRVNVDTELALRRTASAASTSITAAAGLGDVGDDALPKLRPATAPDPAEDVTAPASGLHQSPHSPHHRGSKQSTLKQVRQDASSSSSSLSLSPIRSSLGSSAATGTPKRRSHTLEPLAISPPSPASATASMKWG